MEVWRTDQRSLALRDGSVERWAATRLRRLRRWSPTRPDNGTSPGDGAVRICHRGGMGEQRTADRVVEALAAEGLLAPGTDDRARTAVARALSAGTTVTARAPTMPKLVEVVAYLGGALVLAAGFLFVLRSWDDLGDIGKVSFLAAVAVVLGVAGVLSRAERGLETGSSEIRRRLGGTLLTGAALAAGVDVGVALEVFTDQSFGDVYWPAVAGGIVVCAGSVAAYRLSSTAVGLVGMLGGALVASMNLGSGLATGPSSEALGVGIGVFAVASAWVLLTELGIFAQHTAARALGATVAVLGGQVASFTDGESWVGYLMSVVIAVVGVWLYLSRLDWPYLAAAVIAVTLVVPEAVSDWTEGSLGVVGGVLVAGITLLAASYAGYRLRKEATD